MKDMVIKTDNIYFPSACFHNYHNFKRIRKNLGVEKYYVLWPDNHFAFRDYEWENVYSSGPWPLNLLGKL